MEGIPNNASGNDLAFPFKESLSNVVIDQAVDCNGSGNPPLAVTTIGASSSTAPSFTLGKAVIG